MVCYVLSLLALVNCLYKEYKYNDEMQFTVNGSILCSCEFQIYIILKHFLIPCLVYSAVRDREKHFFIDSTQHAALQFHLGPLRDQNDSLSLSLAENTPQFLGTFSCLELNFIFQNITTNVIMFQKKCVKNHMRFPIGTQQRKLYNFPKDFSHLRSLMYFTIIHFRSC